MLRKLLQASAVLLILNVGAGFLHYIFQILAARKLDLTDLGRLNLLLTIYSIALVSGLIVQYWAVFKSPNSRHLKQARTLSFGAWLLTGALIFFFRNHPWLPLVFGGGAMILVHFWLGVLQIRQKFLLLGLMGAALALARVSGGLISHEATHFILSTAVAPWVVLGLIPLLASRLEDQTEHSVSGHWSEILLPASIGLGFAVLPSLDLINIRFWFGDTIAGQFTRLQLFSKILFFAPATLMQITLPYYVKLFRNENTDESRTALLRLESAGLGATYLGVLVFALMGGWIARNVLGIPGVLSREITLSCLAVPPLYGILGSLQVLAAMKKPKALGTVFLLAALSPLGAIWFHGESLSHYLTYAAVVNSAIGLVVYAGTRRMIHVRT